MADNVIIKINGDIKDYTAKLEAVQKQTEDLSKGLDKLGIASGVAFALVTAGAVKAVNAFKDSIKPGIELQNILKNQGIFSEKLVKEYGAIATELKKVTGVDDEVITSGQAVIQRFIGQTKVTKELTQAILDFAAGTGVDTVTAFNLVGKSIGTANNALNKYGIEIDSNLTAQEKMQVFIASSNAKFRDQAAAISESNGPLARLSDSFGNVVEKVGEKLAPTIDGIAGSLEKLANAASESDGLGTTIASIAVAIGSLAGGALVVSQLATAFVAVNTAAVTLGISLTVLTGGLAAVVLGIGALTAILLTANKELESSEVLTEKLTKAQSELIELRKKDITGFGVARDINLKTREIELLQKQLKQAKELQKVTDDTNAKKSEQATADKKIAEDLNKQGEKKKKLEDDAKKAAEDALKERKALAKELADAGLSELQALENLRDRRLEIASNDADLRLQIEKDYQAKLTELTIKSSEENTKKLQEEYEKRQAAEKKIFDESVSSPLSALKVLTDENATPEEKSKAAQGGAVGGLNTVTAGAAGAQALVVEGAAMAVDAFAPGIGQALKPFIGALTQGPEAVKAMVKEFTQALPQFITALIESIPVVVEELINAVPLLIEELTSVETISKITNAFIAGVPKIIEAQIKQTPRIISALVANVPELVGSFIDGLIDGADDFVEALIDAINPFSGSDSGVGGFISDVGDFLGFAEGGQASVKRVPSGFAGDRFPAFLSSDELVVKPDVARDLESFLGSQSGGSSSIGGGRVEGLLSQILTALDSPQQINTSIEINGKSLASAILDLNRTSQRLA